MHFHPDHSIHSVAVFRSERVYRFGHEASIALQHAVSIALQLRQMLRAVLQGAQLPLGRLAGAFEGG